LAASLEMTVPAGWHGHAPLRDHATPQTDTIPRPRLLP
jgi:hypothetical protein